MIELAVGRCRVVLDPARGGRLASWMVAAEELLVGPPDAIDASIHWGCFVMAPWPGRLAGARFAWQGRELRLRATHGRHAIHGLTWNRVWTVGDVSPTTATLEIELPREEWPMGGRVRQHVRVTDEGVELRAEVEAADEPMPAAIGWHPWFRRRGDPRLRVDAAAYQLTAGMVPTGATAPARGRTDLLDGPRLGRRRLDVAYLGAASPAVLTWQDLEVRVGFSPSPAPLVVYTPADSVCVEPLTAPPNALALAAIAARAAGVALLAPGERLAATMTLTVTAPAGGAFARRG